MRASLLDVLKSETLEIGFFDSHMSELLSGEWRITPSGDLDSYFDDCNAELDSNSVVDFYIALRQRFVNPNDNGLVVEVALQKINNPEKLSVIHITQDEVLSKRDEGLGIYESRLESTNSPGDSQEAEIARLLTKIYSPDSVFVNPSLENKGEFCDVLVIGNVDAVAIQAKSTIRSEARFSESKERRQSRLTKHFKTALKQARRSERLFYGLNKTVTFDGSLVGLTPRSTL
jgi:hypothetical protein